MKRFAFGLAPLLKVKEQRERIAEARVAGARKDVDTHREQLARLHEALAEAAARVERSMGTALPVETWSALFEQTSRLERAIRDADAALRKAERILRNHIEARTRLSTEVEALQTLREEHREEHRQEAQRAEQERLDEVVLRQWSQAKKPGTRPAGGAR